MIAVTAQEVVHAMLGDQRHNQPKAEGQAFAPTNIALIKYWGKRNQILNLPVTDSLSVSLPGLGASTRVKIRTDSDQIFLNGQRIPAIESFAQRAFTFLDSFRSDREPFFEIHTQMNIPSSAGLASSACGFAALVLALNDLFTWNLDLKDLSILARLGSGSACRSIYSGWVKWQAGVREDGSDSFALPYSGNFQDLYLGLALVSARAKPISSRQAMQNTVATSALYEAWPGQVKRDLAQLEQSILEKNFEQFGAIVERNALSMHATMLSAWPPVVYSLPETLALMQKVWGLRQEGCAVFFTQDAGPNLKLLFQQADLNRIQAEFDLAQVVKIC